MSRFERPGRHGLRFILLAAIGVPGCGDGSMGSSPSVRSAASSAEPHPHRPGEHGGFMAPIGHDEYHVEPLFDPDGSVRLSMRGQDEARLLEVRRQVHAAYVPCEERFQSMPFELKPAPQAGDAPEMTSAFVGVLPKETRGAPVTIVVPSIVIEGARYRFGSKSELEAGSVQMPDSVTAQAERSLFLTAKGKYTDADIAANGPTTASQKYKNFHSSHDFNPKPGDPICPVTHAKANRQCLWIVAAGAPRHSKNTG